MCTHRFLLPLLAVSVVTGSALAQPSQSAPPMQQRNAGGWITQLPPDQWLTSKLEGLDVYSSNNGDKIGDIRDLIFDSSGKVQTVVIGAGGDLGLCERDVWGPVAQIRFG